MYEKIKQEAEKNNATLVVVSKTRSLDEIMSIYNQGQRDFGENRVQELMDKKGDLPNDIRWHVIGHLQTNKVKYIAPFVSLVHSIDRRKVWKEINKEAGKEDRIIEGLLQIKIAAEDSKYGFDEDELRQLLAQDVQSSYKNVCIRGVMGMATFTDNVEQVKSEFDKLKNIFDDLKANHYSNQDNFNIISMGMSGDYKIALESGSTMLRVGSVIFEN